MIMTMPINQNTLLMNDIQPDERLIPWLQHQESLTEKLRVHRKETELTVLAMEWRSCAWWEQFVLNIRNQAVYRREILISSHSIPYWYARTVIPEQCYLLDECFFSRLKSESLANLIFNEPKVERIDFFYYPVGKNAIERYWLPETIVCNSADFLWARMAEFSFMQQARFYLCEVLLTGHIRQIE